MPGAAVKRWVLGSAVAIAGIVALAGVMVPLRPHLSLATPALVLVVPVVAGVAVGGLVSGVVAVACGFVAYDLVFIRPYGTLSVGAAQNWVALGVYAVVMLIVARVFAFLQRTRAEARLDADTTRRLYAPSGVLTGDQAVTGVLQVIADTIREAFGARWVAVLIPSTDGPAGPDAPDESHDPRSPDQLVVAATAGEPTAAELVGMAPVGGRPERIGSPGHEATSAVAGAHPRGTGADGALDLVRVALVARGRPVGLVAMAGARFDRHEADLLQTYANQAALALERSQLREQALRTELLEQVDSLRAALMGAVSHDLRTPLASVKAAVTALRRPTGDATLGPEDRDELLALIEQQSDALDRLVANLLDMTRIQSGALELRREITPVADVVEGGLRASAAHSDDVCVDLPPDLPPVEVDQVLMEQVLANLLDNAVRHSPDGTPVRIEATGRDGVVEISVSDGGPGIPPGDRERVFTMFSRIGDEGRAGLGLAIARAFVEAHGQTIHADAAPGGGARFVVTLPAAYVPADA